MINGNGDSQQHHLPGLAALHLAQQIQARYGLQERRTPSPARHLLQLRPSVAYLARHHHTHLAASLNLAVLDWQRESASIRPAPSRPSQTLFIAPAPPPAPAWQTRLLTSRQALNTVVQNQTRFHERLLDLMEWHTRSSQRWLPLEPLPQQPGQPLERPPQYAGQPVPLRQTLPPAPAPRWRPEPRVLRRSAAGSASPVEEMAGVPGRSAPRPVATPARTPMPPPAPDIGAITNHVLQQLDRRLQAHRERHGQVR